MSQSKPRCPHYRKLIPYVYRALQDLGGSGTNSEIRDSVIALMGLSDDIVDLPHTGKASQNNELDYQLGWARTRLREKGWIANSARGTWIISEGPETTDIDEIRRRFNEAANGEVSAPKNQVEDSPAGEETENGEEGGQQQALAFEQEYEEPWLEELKAILHEMSPYAFERLAGYLLRECGFVQVEVTKKSGDGESTDWGNSRSMDSLASMWPSSASAMREAWAQGKSEILRAHSRPTWKKAFLSQRETSPKPPATRPQSKAPSRST